MQKIGMMKMYSWKDVFSDPELYRFAKNITDGTEDVNTMSVFGDFLINHNADFATFLSLSLVWDLADESDKDIFIGIKFAEQDLSKMHIVLEFMNKKIKSSKLNFDAGVRSHYILTKQLRNIGLDEKVAYLEELENVPNENCLFDKIKISVGGVIAQVKLLESGNGYDISTGAIGAIIKHIKRG